MVDLAMIVPSAPARMTSRTSSSCTPTTVTGTETANPRVPTSAEPPARIEATTITITYERSDALCSDGPIARLTRSSPDRPAVYSRSVPVAGFQVRLAMVRRSP